jgi:flagellar biosynthesis chaperone FliJ
MSPRRTRIEKVVTLREKELDKRVQQLAGTRAAEARALSAEEQKKLDLEKASESRLKLAEEGEALSAKNWIEANEWLANRRLHHEKARVDATQAQLETQKAQGAVLVARTDLKKVELLSERIQKQEDSTAQRVERRLEDELSALRFRRTESEK